MSRVEAASSSRSFLSRRRGEACDGRYCSNRRNRRTACRTCCRRCRRCPRAAWPGCRRLRRPCPCLPVAASRAWSTPCWPSMPSLHPSAPRPSTKASDFDGVTRRGDLVADRMILGGRLHGCGLASGRGLDGLSLRRRLGAGSSGFLRRGSSGFGHRVILFSRVGCTHFARGRAHPFLVLPQYIARRAEWFHPCAKFLFTAHAAVALKAPCR